MLSLTKEASLKVSFSVKGFQIENHCVPFTIQWINWKAHGTIKTAIKARKQNWLDALSIVLFGLWNLPTDQDYSPAVAITVTSVLLPKTIAERDSMEFTNVKVRQLAQMLKLETEFLSEGRLHTVPKSFILREVNKCPHVWLWIDRVRHPLEASYAGPFKVMERQRKYFVIELHSENHRNVSLDRLKC